MLEKKRIYYAWFNCIYLQNHKPIFERILSAKEGNSAKSKNREVMLTKSGILAISCKPIVHVPSDSR